MEEVWEGKDIIVILIRIISHADGLDFFECTDCPDALSYTAVS